MKKFYIVGVTLLMSIMLFFSGCFSDGSTRVLNFLKNTKEFEGKKGDNAYCTVNLTVNGDLTYFLSISYYQNTSPRIDVEGQLEYFGEYENRTSTEWAGIKQNQTTYYYAVRLTEAAEALNSESDLFILASASSKSASSFSVRLVYCSIDNPDYGTSGYVKTMITTQTAYTLSPKQ